MPPAVFVRFVRNAVFAGITGFLTYRHHHRIQARDSAVLCAAAAPAAFLGSLALGELDATTVKVVLYVLMFVSSVFSLARVWHTHRQAQAQRREALTTDAAGPAPRQSQLAAQPHMASVSPAGAASAASSLGVPGPVTESSPLTAPAAPALLPSDDALRGAGVSGRGTTSLAVVPSPSRVDVVASGGGGGSSGGDAGSSSPSPAWQTSTTTKLMAGAVCGFGSALTGTSGPVILLPLLIILHWDIFPSLGHAQTIQIPIAAFSTLGNVLLNPGRVDFLLGTIIAAALVPGVLIGAAAAKRVPAACMKPFVAWLLVVCSVVLIVRLAVD